MAYLYSLVLLTSKIPSKMRAIAYIMKCQLINNGVAIVSNAVNVIPMPNVLTAPILLANRAPEGASM